MFGWIWGTAEYNDVTLPKNLLRKGKEYLSSVINESLTIELSAVDLHNLNCDIEKFRKGDLVRVISIPHKLDRYFLVTKLVLNLDDPKSSKLVLGQTFKTLTQNQLNKDKELKNTVYNINYTVNKEVKSDVENLKKEVNNINNTVVEIPSEYVKTSTFENYKIEVNKKLGRVYVVKGSVDNLEALQLLEDKSIGDVYNLVSTGANYVYTESGWDKLSENVDLSNYLTTQQVQEDFYNKEYINNNLVSKIDYEELLKRIEILESKENGGNTDV